MLPFSHTNSVATTWAQRGNAAQNAQRTATHEKRAQLLTQTTHPRARVIGARRMSLILTNPYVGRLSSVLVNWTALASLPNHRAMITSVSSLKASWMNAISAVCG